MTLMFLLRLALDFLAIGLFLVALAYDWLGNSAHEIVGTALFILLISHNTFNRRWYATITRGRGDLRLTISKSITLSLLLAMLALLVTSVIISQTVFGFLPLTSTFSIRQIHAAVAYLALLAVGAHLGLHWSMILGMARSRMSVTTSSKYAVLILRISAVAIAVFGIHGLFAVNAGSKLLMQMSFQFWDFERETLVFFLYHVAIVGLCVFVVHYILKIVRLQKRTTTRSPR